MNKEVVSYMTRFCTRVASLFVLTAVFLSSAIPAFAANMPPIEPQRDSKYFSSKQITVLPGSNGQLKISITVKGKSIMTEIGAIQVCVYEKQQDGSYAEVYTYTRYNRTGMILMNRRTAEINITYNGTPGKYYYVTAACFCKNASGSETSWVGSSAVKV